MEVEVHGFGAPVLLEGARANRLAGIDAAERDPAPDAGVGRVSDVGALGEAASVLHWDLSVMMPSGGA